MEYQSASAGYAADGDFLSAYTSIPHSAPALKCGLPLGVPMLCGDTRHREDCAPDSEVIAGGVPSRDVWFIRSGILRLQRYAQDGRRQILSLFFPGEIVGFEGEFRDGVTVEAVTQSGLCRIDRRKFDTMLTRNDDLRAAVFRQKQDQLDRLHWLTWSLGALSPEERFCAFLALSTRFMPCQPLPDGGTVLSMVLPRVDIADLLGTTVETICRINRRLSDTGVIEMKDSSHFRITDLKRLTALGQIETSFDRLARGIVDRRKCPDGLAGKTHGGTSCFCGR